MSGSSSRARKPKAEAPAPVVDPAPVTTAPSLDASPVRVRALGSGNVSVGEAHYTLRPGAIMVVQRHVADALIAQRMAEEV